MEYMCKLKIDSASNQTIDNKNKLENLIMQKVQVQYNRSWTAQLSLSSFQPITEEIMQKSTVDQQCHILFHGVSCA